MSIRMSSSVIIIIIIIIIIVEFVLCPTAGARRRLVQRTGARRGDGRDGRHYY